MVRTGSDGGGAAHEIDQALARSILYEALALGLRPPGPEVRRRLMELQGVRALALAAAVCGAWAQADLVGAVLALALPPEPEARLEAAYRRLFGHTTRGAVSVYETEYGEDTAFQQPQQLGDLVGFLTAFGLALSPGVRERVDHASVECEFMAFLCRKEAYSVEHGEAEMLEETRRASRLFLRDHLGRFAPALGRLMAREDSGGFYGALGELCRRFAAAECARVEVPAGPEFLPLRAPEEDRTPMACGRAEELLQIRDAGPEGGEPR